MKEIREMFKTIEDPRHESYIEHQLSDILILIMGAVICGLTELCEMMMYFEKNKSFYEKHFNIQVIPSKPTFSRILSLLNPDAVGKVLIGIMLEHNDIVDDILAFDGKAIRGTGTKGKNHSFLQILSCYATDSGITLAQKCIEYEDKTNEIPVLQNMLDVINIEGKTVTADAMHCQKVTCTKVINNNGDYVFGVKANQKELFEHISCFLDDTDNFKYFSTYQTIEKNGGRIEKRICRATSDIAWIYGVEDWSGIKSIFSVTRITTAGDRTTQETGYYISSHTANAEKLLHTSRTHWKIESMHWFLDVVFGEDNNGFLSDNAHKVLNSFRKIALFAHKQYLGTLPKKKRSSVKQNVFAALLDKDVCLNVMKTIGLGH